MITKGIKDDKIIIRKIKKYGDLDIVWQNFNSKNWKKLLFKPKEALLDIFIEYCRLNTAALAYSVNVFWRCKFGVNTTGWILSIYVLSSLISYNADLYLVFKPFANFLLPLAPFLVDGEWLHDLTIANRRSTSVLIFSIAFLALTLIHTVQIYLKKGNKDKTKRGDSWIYIGLSKFILVNETFVQLVVEPFFTALIGWVFYKYGGDLWMAIYLWLAAASVVMQQLIDISELERNNAIIDTA